MLRLSLMMTLLSGCGGVASIDLTFGAPPPQQDGSTNFAFTVTEGSGTSGKILSSQVLPFDADFSGADIRVPFGGQRMVLATLETAEPPVRVLFSGRSGAFRLEDSDHPTIFITMLPSPAPGGI